jgi:hypothetical protein
MSLLRHIRACNAYDPSRFLPLWFGGQRIGLVRRDNAAALARFPAVFAVSGGEVTLVAQGDFEALSGTVDRVIEALVADGIVAKWRNEFFSVRTGWGQPPLFKVDRGAVSFLGIRSFGVHLNGIRRDADGLKLWIGRRALDKKVDPGKLDNMVAGGIGHGHGVFETLAKEGEEEAAVPAEMMRRAVPVSAIVYRMEVDQGVRDDALFIYDLEVPAAFSPRNTDGEIAEFQLMAAGAVLARARATADFKFNVNLVLIDFALRHGLIGSDDEEYLELLAGLHRLPS